MQMHTYVHPSDFPIFECSRKRQNCVSNEHPWPKFFITGGFTSFLKSWKGYSNVEKHLFLTVQHQRPSPNCGIGQQKKTNAKVLKHFDPQRQLWDNTILHIRAHGSSMMPPRHIDTWERHDSHNSDRVRTKPITGMARISVQKSYWYHNSVGRSNQPKKASQNLYMWQPKLRKTNTGGPTIK